MISQRCQMLFLIVLVFGSLYLGYVPCATASQFVGEEGDSSSDVTDDGLDEDEEAPPPSRPHHKKRYDEAEEPVRPSRDNISISGGLGAGVGFFSGEITVGYGFNRYIGIDTTVDYFRFDTDNATGEQYGPEVDLVLRLANPTILTPFVGAGPGYISWKREYKGEVFDQSSSATANAFAGINIRLTGHFGIQVERKQTTYMKDPPRSFSDRETREAKSSVSTNIGFHLSF